MPATGDGSASQGWGQLLNVLTNEELEQYGQLARDQISGEFRRVWVYFGLVVVSLGLVVSGLWMLSHGGFGWIGYFALGIGIVLLYWPYRSIMTCRLWEGHYQAVRKELERRENETVTSDK